MDNKHAGLKSSKIMKAKLSRFLNVFGVHSGRDVVKNVACVFCADLQAQLRDLCVFPHRSFQVCYSSLFPFLFLFNLRLCICPFARIIIIFIFSHTAAVEPIIATLQTFFWITHIENLLEKYLRPQRVQNAFFSPARVFFGAERRKRCWMPNSPKSITP